MINYTDTALPSPSLRKQIEFLKNLILREIFFLISGRFLNRIYALVQILFDPFDKFMLTLISGKFSITYVKIL